MATYGSLLIDAGGGVIDHQKQSDKQPGATVVIGLGGTGSDAVIKLKKEVYKQLKADNQDSAIPKYKDIKYLIIDSDAAKVKASKGRVWDIDESTEFFSLSNNAIKAAFGATEIMRNRREMDWLDYEHISIDDASAGAGGIRQVGRFLLVDRAGHLYSKIKSTFQSALIGASGKLTVHICAGISGGTGSGTFLDVCYLVREVLRELGKPESNVCGYFFLPDVNLSVPTIAADSLKSKFISVNGFAALKEVDYCMNYSKNKDSFKMNYGFRIINDAQKPVDLCYLVSTTDQQGRVIENGYDYAMGVVTDFIISFLAKVQLPQGVSAESDTSGITLEGHISNLNTIRAGIQLQHGGIVDYNVLGASIAEMPLSEIATYLGYKLFESYSELYDRMPTAAERDNFLAGTQLKYEDIKKALTKGCRGKIEFPARFDLRMFREQGRKNGRFVDFADEYLAKNKGELEKNAKTFMEEARDFIIPANSTSLIGRTCKGLCDKYVTKLEFGPFFAQRMLYGTSNQNLIHAVDGFIAENQKNLEAELRQSELRDQEYDDAFVRMSDANFLNEKKRFEEYLNALNNLYVHHYKVEMLQTMDTVLRTYREQLAKLNNNFFRVLTTVLDTLRETFKENGKVLTQGEEDTNSYTWKILSVPKIVESLDKEIQKIDLQNTLYELMTTMMENCTKWINADENEISKLISDFVLTTFRDATQKTISDYLSIRFNVPKDNLHLLANHIENSILAGNLEQKSTPLFWNNPMYQNDMGMHSTLTVPYNSAEIKKAANDYAANHMQFLVRESSITDKISMMRFYSGLPMYAYQGLLQLQDEYEKDTKPGRHLYERGDVNWNEWLPSPIPASFKVGIPVARIEDRNTQLLKEFEEAEKLGVVKKNTLGHWEIQKTEEFDVDAYIEKQGGYRTNGKADINKIRALASELKQEKERLLHDANSVRIECGNTKNGSERQVMLDFYLASPVLNHLLKEELKKQETMNGKIKELDEMEGIVGIEVLEKKNFFNAIFTGVLSYGNIITYTYDEFGMEKAVTLQNNDMEYGDTGAYQAYITYKELNEAVKKKIVTETKLRMNEEEHPDVKAAVEKLDANMSKRIARYAILHDETDPIHEDLERFYGEFMKAFQAFKLMV